MAQYQTWLFLYEKMSKSDFKLTSKSFEDVANAGFSFQTILSFIELEGSNVEDYNFFIFSDSMKAVVQLLNDESVKVTYRLYCEKDQVVTVIVRPAEDPSPNSSQCPSAPQSLRQRRKVSGKSTLQSVFVRPPVKSDTKNIDAESLLPISSLPESEKVVLDLGQGRYETFSATYLTGWIMAEIEKGTALDSIVVTSITPNGRPSSVKLDKDVWVRSLLRGPTKGRFLQIWNMFSSSTIAMSDALNILLQDFPYFEVNSKIFIQDLMTFGSKPQARSRLLSTNHPFFLGGPYFSPAAVDRILALPVQRSTLKGQLDDLMRKKAERGQDEELCASHDLAPLFLRGFGLVWENFKKEKLVLRRTKDNLKKSTKTGTLRQALSKLKLKDDYADQK